MGDGKGWNNCSRSVRFGLMIRQFSPNSQRIEKLLSEAREGAKNACRKFLGKRLRPNWHRNSICPDCPVWTSLNSRFKRTTRFVKLCFFC